MVIVRPATIGDIPALVELMVDFYAESAFPLDRRWASDAFRELLSDPTRGAVWLMLVGTEVAGHVVLTVRFAMEFGGLSAIVDDLFVRPDFRRRGVARAGLEALYDDAVRRGCKSLHVEVAPSNVAAMAAYRGLGMAPGRDLRQELKVMLPST